MLTRYIFVIANFVIEFVINLHLQREGIRVSDSLTNTILISGVPRSLWGLDGTIAQRTYKLYKNPQSVA